MSSHEMIKTHTDMTNAAKLARNADAMAFIFSPPGESIATMGAHKWLTHGVLVVLGLVSTLA